MILCHHKARETQFFFFNDTATTEIYTLSLHDALPISAVPSSDFRVPRYGGANDRSIQCALRDRKSTRLNSSHGYISYAVFCLKKKKRSVNDQRRLAQRPPPHASSGEPRACAPHKLLAS